MSAVTPEISEALIRENIVRSVKDVFKTMLRRSTKLDQVSVGDGDGDNPAINREQPLGNTSQVVGTVGFLGEINGLIYLHFDDDFAKCCAGQMLGMTAEELTHAGDEVVNDAIGEITNMTVGSFKNSLSDQGYPCKLTIPSILRGSKFSIEPISDALRFIYTFESEGQRLVADIILKTGD
jgi:chemotaxis protein CheX